VIDFKIFGSRAQQMAGLDISTSAVKLLELSGGHESGYRVERYAIEPLPDGVVQDGNLVGLEAVGDAIARAVKRLGGQVRHVAMALPASAVITKKIIVPAGLREQEMEFQVEAEAGQYIPFALDEVSLDFHEIGLVAGADDELEVLVAASRRERVEDRVAAAEVAGLKAVVMDVESFAAEAAFELIDAQNGFSAEGKVVALVDIGASVMTVSMLRDGVQLYTREQSIGGRRLTQDIARQYGMPIGEAETAKRLGGLPEGYERELLHPFFESVALEVSRALQFFFTSTQFNAVDHIVLSGGPAVMAGLTDVVAERTRVKTTVANPFAAMGLSSHIKARTLAMDAPALMVACGLALRRFDA